MGASRSNSSQLTTGMTAPTRNQAPTQQAQAVEAPARQGYSSGSSVTPSAYLQRTRETASGMPSSNNYVSEMRRAGSQMFGQALGMETPSETEEDTLKVPGISSSRMAGDIVKSLSGGFTDQLDPTKEMTQGIEDMRYGVTGTTKTKSPYTSFLGG